MGENEGEAGGVRTAVLRVHPPSGRRLAEASRARRCALVETHTQMLS